MLPAGSVANVEKAPVAGEQLDEAEIAGDAQASVAPAVTTAAAPQLVPANAVSLGEGLTQMKVAKAGVPAKDDVDEASDLGIAGGNALYILLGLVVVGGAVAVAAGGGGGSSDDGNGGTPPPANRVPVAADDTFATAEGAGNVSFSVATNDTDADSDTLTYAANGMLPDGVTITPQGQVQVNASSPAFDVLAAGATQNLTFSYTVSDGRGGTDTANVTITVTGVNDAPVAVADTATAAEDGMAVTGNVGANDTDADAGAMLTYTLNAPVAGLTLSANGSYSFDPSVAAYQDLAAGATRNVVANYTVTDQAGATATATLTITVTGVNDAPVIVSAAVATVAENAPAETVVYIAEATDADPGDTIRFSLAGDDSEAFSIDPVTGEVRLVGAANFERQPSYTFTVVATDSATPGLTDTQAVTVTVTDELDVLSLDGLGVFDDPVTVNAGIQADDLTDTNFQFTETSGEPTEVIIENFGENDFIFFDGFDPGDYTFQNDGNGNLVISRLDDDGETTNIITLAGTTEGGIDPSLVIVTEADAEAALAQLLGEGDYFRGSAEPFTIGTTGIATFNAAGRASTIVEDLSGPESLIVVQNFRSDDVIRFENGDPIEVSFQTGDDDSRDLQIIYIDPESGDASTIILDNVLDENSPIPFDEASAEAALALTLGAGDYFQFG